MASIIDPVEGDPTRVQTSFKRFDQTITSNEELHRSLRSTLLDQFYATLRVTYLAATESSEDEANNGRIANNPQINAELKRLFEDEPRTWQKAYNIELQLVQIMTRGQVQTEWARRSSEAKALQLPYSADLTEQWGKTEKSDKSSDDSASNQTISPDDLPIKKTILQRLLNDLQWFYYQRIRRRDAAKLLAIRVSRLFWISFGLFVLILFLQRLI